MCVIDNSVGLFISLLCNFRVGATVLQYFMMLVDEYVRRCILLRGKRVSKQSSLSANHEKI